MATACIFNTQGFSLHDGAGIRTCVFFKGCPLRCAWCHNPEGLAFDKQWSMNAGRCTGCGACQGGAYPEKCVFGARTLIGREVTPEELFALLMRERVFFEQSGGGVTLSGGECLSQPLDFLLPLLQMLKERGVRVNIDTCGAVPWERIAATIPYTDVYLYDLKLMDDAAHRRYTGAGNALILDNLKRLAATGARVWLRVPLISGVNDTPLEQSAMRAFAQEHLPGARVSLLPYHAIGRDKFARLGMDAPERFSPPGEEQTRSILAAWRAAGFDASIGG